MKRIISCVFVFILFLKTFSQDSICYNDKSKIAAIVKKITPSEVEFIKFNNPNGLVIVEKKSLIKYIRYQDGSIDSIRKYPLPSAAHYYEFESAGNKLYFRRNMFIYKYIFVQPKNLKLLLNSYPYENSKKTMLLNLKYSERYDAFSSAFFISSLFSANAAIFGLEHNRRNKTLYRDDYYFISGALALLTCSIIYSVKFHRKSIKTKKELVKIYNEMK